MSGVLSAAMLKALAPPYGGVDQYTKLLCNFNGQNDGTAAVETVLNSPLTFVGNAKTSIAQAVYGASSLLLDGNGDAVTAPNSAGHGIGTADFAIECWVLFSSLPASNTYMNFMNSGWDIAGQSSHFFAAFNNAGTRLLRFHWSTAGAGSSDGGIVGVTWVPSTNVWYHVAFTRSGTTGRFFVNGVQVGGNQTVSASIHSSTGTYRFGSAHNNNHYLDGRMQGARLSVGVPRWTSNFTPPNRPYC